MSPKQDGLLIETMLRIAQALEEIKSIKDDEAYERYCERCEV
jgi:hypothetical protein